jgi:ethanolamine ammonia-lyase small subunit
MKPPVESDPWAALRRFTPARIALGRAGGSLPTQALLEFSLAHAQARDAVQVTLDVPGVLRQLAAAGYPSLVVESAARDREQYLRRPDAGRRLSEASLAQLAVLAPPVPSRLAILIGDGLSAAAAERHAVPLLNALRLRLAHWLWAPVVLARQARVALGDHVGALLQAEAVVVLIGERPGLSAPDSLGIYLTYAPRLGRTDAERNCISNVRPAGLSYEQAAQRLALLLGAARRLGASGVALKDESDPPWNPLPEAAAR